MVTQLYINKTIFDFHESKRNSRVNQPIGLGLEKRILQLPPGLNESIGMTFIEIGPVFLGLAASKINSFHILLQIKYIILIRSYSIIFRHNNRYANLVIDL